MAQPIVRDIENEVVDALEERAGRHGRSAAAEHRELLREALLRRPAEDPRKVLLGMPYVGEEEDFERVQELMREISL